MLIVEELLQPGSFLLYDSVALAATIRIKEYCKLINAFIRTWRFIHLKS